MNVKNVLKRCICVVLAVSAVMAMIPPFSVSAAEEEKKVVRVGLFEDTYYKAREDGELYGYGYEYINKIAGYAGWTLENVEADWYTCFDKLESGEIDILNGISYTDERAEKMLFSSLPMSDERYYLYVDTRNVTISPSDVKSIDGKTVGVMVGAIPEQVLDAWEDNNGISTVHTNITTAEDVLANLEAGKMDCFVSVEEIWDQDYILPVLYIGSSDVYFAINKDRADLKEEMDSAMSRITNDDPFYTDTLYKKFFSAPTAALVSDEEKAKIQEHGSIRIGYVTGEENISTEDKTSGELGGVIKDYIEYAKDCLTGTTLNFEAKGYSSLTEEIEALHSGEIDMIFNVPHNMYYAVSSGLSLSDTCMSVPYIAVTLAAYFDEDAAHTVAVIGNDQFEKWYIDDSYPNWKIVEYDSADAVEKAVKKGEADCFIDRTGNARQYIKSAGYNVHMLERDAEVSFGVDNGDAVLLSILNKTLKAMTPDMLTNALSVYDSEKDTTTISEYVSDNLAQVITALTVLLLFLAIIIRALHRSKTAEARLQDALALAQQATHAKTTFLTNMSHDIRTPMNAIIGYTALAQTHSDDKEQVQDYLAKIHTSSTHLLSLINQILDMSRIESGTVKLDEGVVHIPDVLHDLRTMIQSQITEKQQHLSIDMIDVVNEDVITDKLRLNQILLNIVSNAIKYTGDGGHISIRVKEMPSSAEDHATYQFSVKDDGCGMSPEFVDHVFELFSRERTSTVSGIQGTGLGMSITKNIVDMMNGTITVESEPDKGSEFVVTLDFKVAEGAADHKAAQEADRTVAASTAGLAGAEHAGAGTPTTDAKGQETSQRHYDYSGKHVLLVEDNELNREIATAILAETGMTVDTAEDGTEAVDIMYKSDEDKYDLIFMDIQMPKMDGYTATGEIRTLKNNKKANIPIIAMTANAFEEDKKKAFEAGMNGHIAKPISIEAIAKVLDEIFA